jgi:hypothetical protein
MVAVPAVVEDTGRDGHHAVLLWEITAELDCVTGDLGGGEVGGRRPDDVPTELFQASAQQVTLIPQGRGRVVVVTLG